MTEPGLARRLGTGDAVVVGLSAMVGAGVFLAFAPAARAAGAWLLLGLGVAAVIAFCNAVASVRLAMTYPSSRATYPSAVGSSDRGGGSRQGEASWSARRPRAPRWP